VKVGIVVDGQAESQALKRLLPKIKTPRRNLTGPAYADIQPRASAAQIARSVAPKLKVLQGSGADAFVVLLDCEDAERCPPRFAREIEQALAELDWPGVDVVVKRLSFENWLIADVHALREMRARFRVTRRFEKKVSPNKADHVADAQAELGRLCLGDAYHKRRDPVEIARHQQPRRIAENSRSFRRFLRVVGCGKYANQSRNP
jgi:hypothetical protein